MAEETTYTARLKDRYEAEIRPRLQERLGYSTPMRVPRLEKITLNMGVGEAKTDRKALEHAQQQLGLIAGQHPIVTKAKKSIAGFKIREGMEIGTKVTLRGTRMYEFLDRLTTVALPRIRDFRGINPNSFDGRGNFSVGIREQIIFPEVDYDRIDQVRGLDVTITTTARADDEARELLREFGMPFREDIPAGQGRARLQVSGAQLHPLPALRALARGLQEVRGLPHLPARARPPGRHPRHDEVELVGGDMVTDPIADMLTRIRNANTALQEHTRMPSSKAKIEIAKLLHEEGYIASFRIEKSEPFDKLVIELKYGENRERVISGVKRISKPGRRIYAQKDRLPRVLGGLGTAILSTSSGLVTAKEAAARGVGGEVLCFVW